MHMHVNLPKSSTFVFFSIQYCSWPVPDLQFSGTPFFQTNLSRDKNSHLWTLQRMLHNFFSSLSSNAILILDTSFFQIICFPLFQNPTAPFLLAWLIFAPSLTNTSAIVFCHYCFIRALMKWWILNVSLQEWFKVWFNIYWFSKLGFNNL